MYELNMTTMLFFFVCQYFVYILPNGFHGEETRDHPTHRIAQFLIVLFHILRFRPNTFLSWQDSVFLRSRWQESGGLDQMSYSW